MAATFLSSFFVSAAEPESRTPDPVLVKTREAALDGLRSLQAVEVAFCALQKEECSICCEGVRESDGLTELPCEHKFHTRCVRKWLLQSHKCPYCRYELPAQAVVGDLALANHLLHVDTVEERTRAEERERLRATTQCLARDRIRARTQEVFKVFDTL